MAFVTLSTVVTPAVTYDLTTLAVAKDELSIKTSDSTYDQFLKRAITQASKSIANYCNRVFQVETISDVFQLQNDAHLRNFPRNAKLLQLSRWPLVGLTSVTEDSTVLVEGVDFRADYDTGQIYRLDSDSDLAVGWPSKTVVVVYSGGYAAIATQSANVPVAPGPYTVTVTNSASFVRDRGVTYANGVPLTAVASAPAGGQYAVIAGVYTFNASDAAAAILAAYSFQAIPDDVADAVLRLITTRFRQRGRDPMLMSKSNPQQGDERYWVGAQAGQNGALPPEIAGILDAYVVPVIA